VNTPEDAVCADTQPAHRGVKGGLHGGVDGPRIPGAARSAKFAQEQVREAICPLLGYIPNQLRIEGSDDSAGFLAVEEQIQGGMEVYQEGARQWREFLPAAETVPGADLDPLGRG